MTGTGSPSTAAAGQAALPVVVATGGGILLADPVLEARLARLARKAPTPPTDLPLNASLLRWLRDQAADGRTIALVDRDQDGLAQALAARIGPGVAVLRPSGLPAGGCLWIGPPPAPSYASESLDPRRAFPPGESGAAALWRGMRPHHWIKNLLVLLPLIAAHCWDEPALWTAALAALVVFCLASSSVYLVNDLLDLADDRAHPLKRRRPVAVGHLGVATAGYAAAGLLALALGLAALTAPGLAVAIAGYALAALTYSLRIKRIPFLDVLWLAGLYTARVLAGAAATGIAPTGWLIAFCACIMGALACAKRSAELLATPERAASRGYRPGKLRPLAGLGLVASVAAVVTLVLHAFQPETAGLYVRPWLLVAVAGIVALWLARIWAMVARRRLSADPILFALRDGPSWLAFAAVAGFFAAAVA